MISPTFQSVTRVNQSEWAYAPKALSRANVGDLLHVGELNEKRGALLKIRRTGSFVSVSSDQAWRGAPIPWPRAADGVKEIVIDPKTRKVRFIPTDRPACSGGEAPVS
jgi:hypothetical protein